jgi:DNA-binding MarR family transcriptional regulator
MLVGTGDVAPAARKSVNAQAAERDDQRRHGGVLLYPQDLVLLAWLAEQYGARTDQVERLLGCSRRAAQRTVARLRRAGLLSSYRLLVGEPEWVTPTRAGLRACGCTLKVWQPKLGQLLHAAAVNDVRLHIAERAREAQWICERTLVRERERGEHLPDAVVVLDEQRIALEVELTVKSPRRVRAIMAELVGRYDLVLYFCAAATHRQLSALARSGAWPTLGVRELPGGGAAAR